MRCYHGTSADNLESIRQNGLLSSETKIWSCSHDAVYCWTNRYLDLEYPDWEDDGCDPDDILIRQASESASCSLAKAKDCRIVVVVFEVDESELDIDDSCDNMEHANCVRRDIRPEEILEIHISNDLSLIRALFIRHMMNNDMSGLYFTRFEIEVANCFKDFYIDLSDLLEWETVLYGENCRHNYCLA